MNLVWDLLLGEVENEKVLTKEGNTGDRGLSLQGFGRQIL